MGVIISGNPKGKRLPVRRGSLLEFIRALEEKQIPPDKKPLRYVLIDGTEVVPAVEPRTAILRWFEE
jgi:hypothetical protein